MVMPQQPMPPGPGVPPGAGVDPAMGRYSRQGAAAQDGPDQAARAAALEARAQGADPQLAARAAWKAKITELSQRLTAPDYAPTDPGEGNLHKAVQHLTGQGMDAVTATAMGHEFIATLAGQQQAAKAQQQAGPAPAPGGPPPVPPIRPGG